MYQIPFLFSCSVSAIRKCVICLGDIPLSYATAMCAILGSRQIVEDPLIL